MAIEKYNSKKTSNNLVKRKKTIQHYPEKTGQKEPPLRDNNVTFIVPFIEPINGYLLTLFEARVPFLCLHV